MKPPMFLNKLAAAAGWGLPGGGSSGYGLRHVSRADPPPAQDQTLSWSPRWYLWDGGFLAVGRTQGVIPPHAHHAIQIVLGLDGPMSIRGAEGDWRQAHGIIVRPDAVHSFNGNGATGAMIFVDAESTEGLWLRASLREDITIAPDARLDACLSALRTFHDHPLDGMEIGALIRLCVQTLSAGAPPARRLDPRVTRLLQEIRESDDLRVSLERAAASAFLSPSRFAHLFKQQVGLPFRRYMLWRKLTRAMLAIGREGTIAAAAHAADFADAAHLTRTFYQMFGIPPSVMMRGEFFEVKPPFEFAPLPVKPSST
jgi:AraC-like DNA-binding protein